MKALMSSGPCQRTTMRGVEIVFFPKKFSVASTSSSSQECVMESYSELQGVAPPTGEKKKIL